MADQSSTPSAREFGAAFKSFLELSVGEAPATESAFAARIRTHLGADPATLPTVSDTHEVTDQPNLQLALDDWLGGPGRSFEALGVASEYKRIGGLGLGDLLAPAGGLLRAGPAVGPVEWVSLLAHRYGPPSVRFHELPMVVREDIVLPDGLLERLERHTVGFSRHRERLLAAGRHLRRGILLHGRPGTGKTLTTTYLARRMDDRTVVLVTGREVGMLRRSCELARAAGPLDGGARGRRPDRRGADRAGTWPDDPVFELLNEMDGLPGDADVVVLLTSNRPELLEPALVARPGRVDLAVEIPLPDPAARRRLFELYGRGLVLRVDGLDRLVGQTEGVSPAFIRELLRKAALLAVGPGEEIVVEDRHLDQALHELVVGGGELTRRLLGAAE
jgi:hypothetical protein